MPRQVTLEGYPLETGLSGTYEYTGEGGSDRQRQPVYVNKRTSRESDGYLTRDVSAEGEGRWRVVSGFQGERHVYSAWSSEASILPTMNDDGAALRWLRIQDGGDLDCADDPLCFEENPPEPPPAADEPTERDKVSRGLDAAAITPAPPQPTSQPSPPLSSPSATYAISFDRQLEIRSNSPGLGMELAGTYELMDEAVNGSPAFSGAQPEAAFLDAFAQC